MITVLCEFSSLLMFLLCKLLPNIILLSLPCNEFYIFFGNSTLSSYNSYLAFLIFLLHSFPILPLTFFFQTLRKQLDNNEYKDMNHEEKKKNVSQAWREWIFILIKVRPWHSNENQCRSDKKNARITSIFSFLISIFQFLF